MYVFGSTIFAMKDTNQDVQTKEVEAQSTVSHSGTRFRVRERREAGVRSTPGLIPWADVVCRGLCRFKVIVNPFYVTFYVHV
jgi:hypothetical protein